MPDNASTVWIPLSALLPFGLLLCRTSVLLVLMPLPGVRNALEVHRLALAVLLAGLLTPFAPAIAVPSLSKLVVFGAAEAALGAALGLSVALMQEGIQLGAQFIGLQAGFAYASTVDPTSEADSAILQVLLTLASSLLFLALGIDTILFRLLLGSVQNLPPGAWTASPQHATALMALFPPLFTDAVRLALPVIAVLLVVDISLALFSRLQPQLQLLTLSFPLKMLASVATVAACSPYLPNALERASARSIDAVRFLLQP